MKIGVFDSGVGGRSVALAIEKAFPEYEVVFVDDSKNLPYGDKTPEQLFELVFPILNTLSNEKCDIIVVACNSVTTNIISDLRKKIDVPLVGIEPMIKPASAMTKTKIVAVCATPATLNSDRYKFLKATYGQGVKFIEPDVSDWAMMIQNSEVNIKKIENTINSVLDRNADVVVLGCTHYHWIAEDIEKICNGRAEVIHPEDAVVARIKQVIEQLD